MKLCLNSCKAAKINLTFHQYGSSPIVCLFCGIAQEITHKRCVARIKLFVFQPRNQFGHTTIIIALEISSWCNLANQFRKSEKKRAKEGIVNARHVHRSALYSKHTVHQTWALYWPDCAAKDQRCNVGYGFYITTTASCLDPLNTYADMMARVVLCIIYYSR